MGDRGVGKTSVLDIIDPIYLPEVKWTPSNVASIANIGGNITG